MWPFGRLATLPGTERLMNEWDHTDGWDGLGATFMMGVWVVLIGIVVYVAVRLAQVHPGSPT